MISEYLQMKNSWNAVVYLSVPTYLHMNYSIATVPWKLMSYCDLLICKEFSNLALFRQSLMLMQTRKKQQTALVKNYNKTVEPLYFQMHFILVEFTEHVKFVNLANNWCQFETLPLWFAVTALQYAKMFVRSFIPYHAQCAECVHILHPNNVCIPIYFWTLEHGTRNKWLKVSLWWNSKKSPLSAFDVIW